MDTQEVRIVAMWANQNLGFKKHKKPNSCIVYRKNEKKTVKVQKQQRLTELPMLYTVNLTFYCIFSDNRNNRKLRVLPGVFNKFGN